YLGWHLIQNRSTPPVKEATREPAPAAKPFKPSTYRKADIVEDVVQEVTEERAAGDRRGTLDLPYAELSFLEKVNYEVLFARNVFSMLSRVVPAGIGLRSLEIENFQTLYAVGLGTSRELVSSTFIALKTEKLELLPKPFSYITSNDGEGYRFVVTCKIDFGLNLADPFQASDHLPARDDLPILTKRISRIGDSTGVSFKGTPKQLDAERVGAYRCFHYRYRGRTTYNDFVKFLLALYDARVPCAFRKINLKALDGTAVDVDLQLIITARE
ncbi:MAG: hypothetical protein JW863_17995, partial [Chitinispirillaceae bacterium]|nr:hypothetical protein [Chitinispirillaceae bacterium]